MAVAPSLLHKHNFLFKKVLQCDPIAAWKYCHSLQKQWDMEYSIDKELAHQMAAWKRSSLIRLVCLSDKFGHTLLSDIDTGFLKNTFDKLNKGQDKGHDAAEDDTGKGHDAAEDDTGNNQSAAEDDTGKGHNIAKDDTDRGRDAAKDDTDRGHNIAKDDTDRGHDAAKDDTDRGHNPAKDDTGRGHDAAKDDTDRGHDAAKDDTGRGHNTGRGHDTAKDDTGRGHDAAKDDTDQGHDACDAEDGRGSEHQQTQHARALHLLITAASTTKSLSVELIKSTHKELMAGLITKDRKEVLAGEFRKEAVHTKTRNYPDHHEIPREMEKITRNYNSKSSKDHDPFELAGWLLLNLLSLHPFLDGNGRVSRLLWCFSLLRDGLPFVITPFPGKKRAYKLYLHCLEAAQDDLSDDPTKFLTSLTVISVMQSWKNFLSEVKRKAPKKFKEINDWLSTNTPT